jgi:hypothetical protein
MISQARVSLDGDGHRAPGEALIAHRCLIDKYSQYDGRLFQIVWLRAFQDVRSGVENFLVIEIDLEKEEAGQFNLAEAQVIRAASVIAQRGPGSHDRKGPSILEKCP